MNEKEKTSIDLERMIAKLWSKRKVFFIVWPVVIVLSCLWVLPKPRYYTCEVKLAPEDVGDADGLASVASSFGLNIGGSMSTDAIYPMLYPELFESPGFISSLLDIQVESDDGSIKTDYYTYMRKHQQKNWLTQPFKDMMKAVKNMLSSEPQVASRKDGEKLDPFKMCKVDYDLINRLQDVITCDVDKRTNVITIKVEDQDRQICALLADSVRERLQDFIIDYRTKKSRQDEMYYKHLSDSALVEYENAIAEYSGYLDHNRNATRQTTVEKGRYLGNDLSNKLQQYNMLNSQYLAMKAKVRERTPAFTTLKTATVPIKPAGPKRMIFVAAMLVLSSFFTTIWIFKRAIILYFTK